jgi:hypothetical protein
VSEELSSMSLAEPLYSVPRRSLAGWTPAASGSTVAVVVSSLETLRDIHEKGYRLAVYRRPCGRSSWIDLAALIAGGRGNRQLLRARLICGVCGTRGELSLILVG